MWGFITLIMVNTVGYTIQLISTFNSRDYSVVYTIHQPTVFNIRDPRCRLHSFHRTKSSGHLKDFQPR